MTASVAPSEQKGRLRGDIQALRAIAVLAVILFHAAGLLPGGFFGVDVFFVISGYVIALSIARERSRTGTFRIGRFFTRRIMRLTPALGVMLITTSLASVMLGALGASEPGAKTGMAASLLGANMHLATQGGYFDSQLELNHLLHTWSLSVEEQFYLLFPGIIWFASKRPTWRSTTLVLVGAGSVLSFALAAALTTIETLGPLSAAEVTRVSFFAMPTRAWQFGAGVLLALSPRISSAIAGRGMATLGWLGLTASFLFITDAGSYLVFWSIIPTLATCLLVANPPSRASAVLHSPRLVDLGDLSYSWYLWHWPVMVFARATFGIESALLLAVVGLATLPLARLSYRHVESRFRSPGKASARPAMRLSAAFLAVNALVLVAVGATVERSVTGAVVSAWAASAPHTADTCEQTRLGKGVRGCRLGEGPTRVLLLGDSNAGHYSEAVVLMAAAIGARVEIVSQGGCPMLVLDSFDGDAEQEHCREAAEAVDRWLTESPPDLLVVAHTQSYVAGGRKQVTNGELTGAAAYEAALDRLAAVVTPAGTRLVIAHATPKFTEGGVPSDGAHACSRLRLALRAESCTRTQPDDEAHERRRLAFEAETRVAERWGAATFDPFPELCDRGFCPEFRGGIWLYSDGAHLTSAASRSLRDALLEVVARDGPVLARQPTAVAQGDQLTMRIDIG